MLKYEEVIEYYSKLHKYHRDRIDYFKVEEGNLAYNVGRISAWVSKNTQIIECLERIYQKDTTQVMKDLGIPSC